METKNFNAGYNPNCDTLRNHFKHSIRALGSVACEDLTMRWDLLCKSFPEDTVLDLFYQAFTRLDQRIKTSIASVNFKPLLSPRGNDIMRELETANQQKIETNPLLRLRALKERHAANLNKMCVLINGNPALNEDDVKKIQLKIPELSKEHEKLSVAFASRRGKVTSLEFEVKF
jgi:hypothetical protein